MMRKDRFCNFFMVLLALAFCFPQSGSFAEISQKIFPNMEGWERLDQISKFSPENLFDYINGAAELYLSYDFQELLVSEYTDSKGASIIIEVYRHKTPDHAFGIYSQERPDEGSFLHIGAQGYLEGTILNFLSGEYYLKINCYDAGKKTEDHLLAFARQMEKNLDGQASMPKLSSLFPEKGKNKNSEKFIARDFLGYQFLHSSFTAEYELGGADFKLFIIKGEDSQDCKNMVTQYLQKIDSPEKKGKEGRFIITDPYHGAIAFAWKGNYIWGIINPHDAASQEKYLSIIEDNLKKEKLLQ